MTAESTPGGADDNPVIPAATVVVLRDGTAGLETLMLRRNSRLDFVGGMWVFPGGRIDPDDHDPSGDEVATARNAAVREAVEEAAQVIDAAGLVWFAHWTPPPRAPKRFGTWFFAARSTGDAVTIDGGEIHDAAWMRPHTALERRDALEIEMAPPTWVTLHYLARFDDADSALAALDAATPRHYLTHIGRDGDTLVALWEGDAGYETFDPSLPGSRHRLVLDRHRYEFDDSAAPYLA